MEDIRDMGNIIEGNECAIVEGPVEPKRVKDIGQGPTDQPINWWEVHGLGLVKHSNPVSTHAPGIPVEVGVVSHSVLVAKWFLMLELPSGVERTAIF